MNALIDMCEYDVGKNVKFENKYSNIEKLTVGEIKKVEIAYTDTFEVTPYIEEAHIIDINMSIKGDTGKITKDYSCIAAKINSNWYILSGLNWW